MTEANRELEAIQGHYTPGQMQAYEVGVAEGRWLESRAPSFPKKSTIPRLKPTNIGRFIASIPRAVTTGEITAAQGNHLLYAAQTLISFLRLQVHNSTPPPPPSGFAGGMKGKSNDARNSKTSAT